MFGVKAVPLLAAQTAHLQHTPCPHVVLGLPAPVPIWLGGTEPVQGGRVFGQTPRGYPGRQQKAAGDISSAGTVPVGAVLVTPPPPDRAC